MPAPPSHPGLELRWPRPDEEAEFLRAHRATTPGYPTFLHYHDEGMPFAAYLQRLREQPLGASACPRRGTCRRPSCSLSMARGSSVASRSGTG